MRHKWHPVCSICRNHNPMTTGVFHLSWSQSHDNRCVPFVVITIPSKFVSFMTCYRIFNMSNTTGANSRAGTAYTSRAPGFILGYCAGLSFLFKCEIYFLHVNAHFLGRKQRQKGIKLIFLIVYKPISIPCCKDYW